MSAAAHTQLRADVERRGIQTPLEITQTSVLLDGRSRLHAALELGQEHVPVRVVAPEDEVEYMVRAAIERRQLTPSQTAALIVEWSKFSELREAGVKRRVQNLRQYTDGATLPPRGKLRDLLAETGNVSSRTVQDAITAFEGDRELFERVKAGLLAAPVAARRVRRAKRDAELPPAPPLPEGPFDLLYADPAWQMGNPDASSAPRTTM
jgi:ParB-like chromosome segregation protein Spo0J